ncbi:A24 family peptidase [Halorhabdus sp. CUG00001]|uniref:A24 family peptidase n=1 Tax=Halorhabdus sp. CUG00001 TaxID=2600297 RepID=UPI00131B25B8|nr:A24 family peptidase [Halorhabdus sp. CUG00001]
MNATLPDLLRLVVVPVLGWAAWRDVRTRRVPNRTWLPLGVLGVVLLAWDGWLAWTGTSMQVVDPRLFALRVAFSLGLLVPFAYAFWWFGGFGGADAKALIVLAIIFPTYPTYLFDGFVLPALEPTLGVFSLTILSNAVLVGLAYPLALAGRNALGGHLGKAMFIGRPISAERAIEEYGRLLETPAGFTRRGLDLDALRMYLRWRGCSLSDLRADPEAYRDPESLPADPNPPGDGSIPVGEDRVALPDGGEFDDPWGAQAFLDDIDSTAYGTTPEGLREGLDVLASAETVWITPGIPFLVPMFGGLLVSLTAGDILVWLLSLVGLGAV